MANGETDLPPTAGPAGGGGRTDQAQSPRSRLRHTAARASDRARSAAGAVAPGREAWLGVAIGATAIAALAGGFISYVARPAFGAPLDAILGAFVGAGAVSIVTATVVAALWLARKVPAWMLGAMAGALLVVAHTLTLGRRLSNIAAAVVVITAALLVGAAWTIVEHNRRGVTGGRAPSIARSAVLLIASVVTVIGAWWLAWPGPSAPPTPPLVATAPGVEDLDAPDPSLPGPYGVRTLTYGSGSDRLRSEYAEDADLLTDPVDATPYVRWTGWQGWQSWRKWRNWRGWLREWRWGFDTSRLPLNAQVWYPEDEAACPCPLVLIVHGNHNSFEFSEPGYAYLGELLASRGYVFVSIDENFLNSGVYGPMIGENDARSWLMLQHLRQWRDWARSPGNPFYGLVDMDHIALMGHSRGGEAAATAAMLNRLEHYPEDARQQFDFDFAIKGVIAFAPSDGQYKPAGRLNQLEDISYLVFHGAQDSDISTFSGLRQYARVTFSSPSPEKGPFKTALYIDRANHGQFNTVWGNRDRSLPTGWLLNTRAIMPGDEQRQIAAVYVSAFLEDALRGDRSYRPLFRDVRSGVKAGWLPERAFVNRYEDPGFVPIATFDEDADVTTISLPGGSAAGRWLTRWRETQLRFRSGKDQQTGAVEIGWSQPRAAYTLDIPDGVAEQIGVSAQSALVFEIAESKSSQRLAGKSVATPADLTVVLTDGNGVSAAVALADHGFVPLPIRSQMTKWSAWEKKRFKRDSEPILQSVRVPLTAFEDHEPTFEPSRITQVRFVFNRSPFGAVILDNVGFDVNG